MAAGKPATSAPEKYTSAKDDNEETQDSSPEEVQAQSAESEPELTEDDLVEFEEKKKIPYSRFKEVNETKKALEAKIEALEQRSQESLATLTAQYEAKLQAAQRTEQDPYSDSSYGIEYGETGGTNKALEEKIAALENKLAAVSQNVDRQSTSTQLERLADQYPEADTTAVLGWAKVMPNAKLEELMEKSHMENVDRQEKFLKNYLETKKAKARQATPTRDFGIKLKEEDRPKTLSQSKAALKAWLNNS